MIHEKKYINRYRQNIQNKKIICKNAQYKDIWRCNIQKIDIQIRNIWKKNILKKNI